MMKLIDGYPAEPELVPLIHAAWVDTEPHLSEWKKDGMCMACSNCKHRAGKNKHKTYRYCPWCGAKMDAIVLDKNHAFEAHVDDCTEAPKEYIFHGFKIMDK
jgi:NADH pyrophosphatase NudC (nudix superfamily)